MSAPTPAPQRSSGIDAFRRRVAMMSLAVCESKAVHELTANETDEIFRYLQDDHFGGPDVSLAGGWWADVVLRGVFRDGTRFTIAIDGEVRLWRCEGYTHCDHLIRPGLKDVFARLKSRGA